MTIRMRMLALISALVLTACAAQNGGVKSVDVASRDCFSASSVLGFQPIDNDTVHLRVTRRDVYELKLMSYCPDIDWSSSIALRNRGGSSWICTRDAMSLEIVVLDRPTGIGPDRCRVRSIRKLGPAVPASPDETSTGQP